MGCPAARCAAGSTAHFDLGQFGAIGGLERKVIAEYETGNSGRVWFQLDLSTDADADTNGGYILTALTALEPMYGNQPCALTSTPESSCFGLYAGTLFDRLGRRRECAAGWE